MRVIRQALIPVLALCVFAPTMLIYSGRKQMSRTLLVEKEIVLQLKHHNVGKMSIEVNDSTVKTRLEARKKHFDNVCSGLNLNPHLLGAQRDLEITLAHGKLKFCGLEKVGSTFLKEIKMAENSQAVVDKDIKEFISFVVVREPYGRLVSAFMDKLVLRPIWWNNYGKYIVDNFRLKATEQEKRCGSDVTFPEFIRYWINSEETGNNVNGHFRSMHKECKFCFFNYDYYVHLETMKDELSYIYESVNATLQTTLSNDKDTLKDMAFTIIDQREYGDYKYYIENCGYTHCDALDSAWATFQGRALIAPDISQPIKGGNCSTVTREEFIKIALDTHQQCKGRIDKKIKRQMVVSLFLQVPLLERLKVRELLMEDFKLHNYDSLPKDIFPEIVQE